MKTFLRLENFKFSEDVEEFKAYEGNKFSYGKKPIGDELFFESFGLLEARGIAEQQISLSEYQGVPAFFQVSTGVQDHHFILNKLIIKY